MKLAAPASGRDPKSMVILLHGYGSNGADLMGHPLLAHEPARHRLHGLKRPRDLPWSPRGYQWWSLSDLGRKSRAAGMRQAAPLVKAFIDMYRTAYDLPNSKVALAGFSQGTMMALHVGPRRSEALAGIVG